MSFWERHVLPHLVIAACTASSITRQRLKVVPHAEGRVLEVGVGSGLNLPWYDPMRVERVDAIDPSHALVAQAMIEARRAPVHVEILPTKAEILPWEGGTFDTIVMTYALCTIPEPVRALQEMRRVLRAGGRLLFSEHGRAPDRRVRTWQERVTPAWSRLGGGCHLDRDIPGLLRAGGFRIVHLESRYLPGWKVVNYHYQGVAVPEG
ncbi:MAG: class I SAM-dependent methyltransferase [Myxococcota bacterium]